MGHSLYVFYAHVSLDGSVLLLEVRLGSVQTDDAS